MWARREALESAIYLSKKRILPESTRTFLYNLQRNLPTSADKSESVYVQVEHTKPEREVFLHVHNWLRHELRKKGAVVESNPTSNLRVLGLPGYAWVPFWGLVASGLTVVLGTDNPGIMQTSVEEEYARLRAAFPERLDLERQVFFGTELGPRILDSVLGRTARLADQDDRDRLWSKIEGEVRKRTLELAVPTPI